MRVAQLKNFNCLCKVQLDREQKKNETEQLELQRSECDCRWIL